MVWCQNTQLPVIRFNTPQLNITNATTTDNGMYHCCKVQECCSGDSVLSTLNVTVYGEPARVARIIAVTCVWASAVIFCTYVPDEFHEGMSSLHTFAGISWFACLPFKETYSSWAFSSAFLQTLNYCNTDSVCLPPRSSLLRIPRATQCLNNNLKRGNPHNTKSTLYSLHANIFIAWPTVQSSVLWL